ncbi:MAG: HD domain-containing phosphohydrolase [Patescibacteria group bacterium]
MTLKEIQYLQMHALMDVLSSALKQFHEYTRAHSVAVSNMNVVLATHVRPGLSMQVLQEYAAGGALHDIGKLAVPTQTLNATGTTLTDSEWASLYSHPTRGVQIVVDTGLYVPQIVRDCIEFHHERWDGRQDCQRPGYPRGLQGTAIPLCARITAVADTWDAITTSRSYQQARPPAEALTLLQSLAGNRLDPELVTLFIQKIAPTLR